MSNDPPTAKANIRTKLYVISKEDTPKSEEGPHVEKKTSSECYGPTSLFSNKTATWKKRSVRMTFQNFQMSFSAVSSERQRVSLKKVGSSYKITRRATWTRTVDFSCCTFALSFVSTVNLWGR